MTAPSLTPGVYCTMPLLGAVSDHEEHWARLGDVATLPYRKLDTSYGRCLALSGGGYRAALFHLGVLRRLNDVGFLGELDTITCVSGGSIIGAALARTIQMEPSWWPTPGESIPTDQWESGFAVPFRAQAGTDIRSVSVMAGGLPFRGLTSGVEALEREVAHMVNPGKMRDLPAHPRFLFCCTEMERGDYWLFGHDHIGPHNGPYKFVLPDYPIARAVAASTCFPPVMDPQVTDFWSLLEQATSPPPDLDHHGWDEWSQPVDAYPLDLDLPSLHAIANHDVPEKVKRYLTSVHLTDGGVFDNNAIEAAWPHASFMVVSDAGGPLQVSWQSKLLWRLQRYQAITSNVARSSQIRWLAALQSQGELSGVYISTKAYGPDFPDDEPSASAERYPSSVRRVIAGIRSDLDTFTEGEIAILENHGYCEAAHALMQVRPPTPTPAWLAATRVPWEEWMDVQRVGKVLEHSHKTMVQGRQGWKAFMRDQIGIKGRHRQTFW